MEKRMNSIILHQYSESPFSEKVRSLLGYKRVSYKKVEIPTIMPRPNTIPLTGGYRKTPVMQIGAEVYCDTSIICRVIDNLYPEQTIYPDKHIATINSVSHWTDTFFFKVCVAIAFQPRAAATNPLFEDESAMLAFMADRAEFSKGSEELSMLFEEAEPFFVAHLDHLERQLASAGPFLFGNSPTIADFSTYHNIWFIYSREILRDYFLPFEHLINWYQKMVSFTDGQPENLSGETALLVAKNSDPEEMVDAVLLDNLKARQLVSVMPTDYGFQPVTGELLGASMDEIKISRDDDKVGRIVVHFPRLGFQISTSAVR